LELTAVFVCTELMRWKEIVLLVDATHNGGISEVKVNRCYLQNLYMCEAIEYYCLLG
jgi:hypothetical protein